MTATQAILLSWHIIGGVWLALSCINIVKILIRPVREYELVFAQDGVVKQVLCLNELPVTPEGAIVFPKTLDLKGRWLLQIRVVPWKKRLLP